MNQHAHDQAMRILVTRNSDVERELNYAVDMAREKAMTERRRGILVTHEAPGIFKVTLSDDVPFGLTRELQVW